MTKAWVLHLIYGIISTQACSSYQPRAPVTAPPIVTTTDFVRVIGTVGTRYINETFRYNKIIPITYEYGMKVNLTCSGNDVDGVLWQYQNDRLNISLNSSFPSDIHRFSMSLYSFDNGTKWSCIATKFLYNITIKFQSCQNESSTKHLMYKDKKVQVNDLLEIECGYGHYNFIIFTNNQIYKKKYVDKPYSFKVTNDTYDNTIFCMSFKNDNNRTHRVTGDFSRLIQKYESSEESLAHSSRLPVTTLAAIIVITCIILIVIVSFIISKRRRAGFLEIRTASHQPEETHSSPQFVEYAELQLEELSVAAAQRRPAAEHTSYSEIIGTVNRIY